MSRTPIPWCTTINMIPNQKVNFIIFLFEKLIESNMCQFQNNLVLRKSNQIRYVFNVCRQDCFMMLFGFWRLSDKQNVQGDGDRNPISELSLFMSSFSISNFLALESSDVKNTLKGKREEAQYGYPCWINRLMGSAESKTCCTNHVDGSWRWVSLTFINKQFSPHTAQTTVSWIIWPNCLETIVIAYSCEGLCVKNTAPFWFRSCNNQIYFALNKKCPVKWSIQNLCETRCEGVRLRSDKKMQSRDGL